MESRYSRIKGSVQITKNQMAPRHLMLGVKIKVRILVGLTWSLCGHDQRAKPPIYKGYWLTPTRLSCPLLHVKPPLASASILISGEAIKSKPLDYFPAQTINVTNFIGLQVETISNQSQKPKSSCIKGIRRLRQVVMPVFWGAKLKLLYIIF